MSRTRSRTQIRSLLRTLPLAAAALLLQLAGPVRADSAPAQTKRLIDTFKKVKSAPEGGKLAAADQAANKKTFTALDGFFDYPNFATDCMGPAAAKLSAPQQKEFKERLIAILRGRGYPNGGKFFNTGVLKELPAKGGEAEGKATVTYSINFPKEDVSTELAFVWKGGKVVDLVLDGDSLAKDYRNQVGRIVAKSGAEDLLRRLAEKQKEIE
jgi:ABC-type transporter MlaC component